MRADEFLVVKGLAPSRAKARALIEEGKVFLLSKIIDKPSRTIPDNVVLRVDEHSQSLRYVSRAGLKLEAFLRRFNIDLSDARVLDAGASTGGFSDCALSMGARECVCVDVGSGQLAQKLLSDARVTNMEKTDVRSLSPETFNNVLFDFICADLSFISLEKVLPSLLPLLKLGSPIVCLVKPQFETSFDIMRKCKGVLRDQSLREAALEKIREFFSKDYPDYKQIGFIQSPIKGGDGNVEFLVGYRKY